jgi:phage tail sheath protein FI
MPVQVSYPGVYVEEIPSGVRTITGVATSITAFVGWAPKGPTDRAEQVLSWMDFERKFGGLQSQSLLGYAVSQFFANGGTQAYIVRLFDKDSAKTASVVVDGLTVTASSPGDWANNYAICSKLRVDDKKRFTLSVIYFADKEKKIKVPVESFENLSLEENDPRYAVSIINDKSEIIKISHDPTMKTPPNIPEDNPKPLDDTVKGDAGKVLKPSDPNDTTGAFETALGVALGLLNSSNPLNLLDKVNLFNLLCVPGETNSEVQSNLEKFCRDRRAFYIADSKLDENLENLKNSGPTGITGDDAINAAYYYPWVIAPDALRNNTSRDFPPSGIIAGIYARTDTARGVWKAPAGIDASITGITGLKYRLTDSENGQLNPKAVNCLRDFIIYGPVVWGARTLRGNDEIGSEWKYIPVRRTALFIEESLFRGLKWVVFEPNDEPLWAQIRLNVGAFMHDLFVQGAFQGTTPRDAYFVKCDKETTTQNDINRGIVNILVGFAPLKPAEFVILKIQQIAGQIQT